MVWIFVKLFEKAKSPKQEVLNIIPKICIRFLLLRFFFLFSIHLYDLQNMLIFGNIVMLKLGKKKF